MAVDPKIGPHPSYVHTKKQFYTQREIEILSRHPKLNTGKEEGVRLHFVNLMDNMRQHLRLPTKTFATASMYFHIFRLTRAELDYNPVDAAHACLFVACKVEDTLKRSKEILAAAKNYRLSAAEQIPWDSGHFDAGAKNAIGMERLVLETIGFNFTSRAPQELIVKLCKYWSLSKETMFRTAYDASLDLYRTYAPLKMSSAVLALACIELAAKIHNVDISTLRTDERTSQKRQARVFAEQVLAFADRKRVIETVQDLLDIYEHQQAPHCTKLGGKYTKDEFVRVKLAFNQIMETEGISRYTDGDGSFTSPRTDGTPRDAMDLDTPKSKPHSTTTSPQDTNGTSSMEESLLAQTSIKEGTLRYMVDPDRARAERDRVDEYFHDRTEDYEVEEEVEVPRSANKGHGRDQHQR